LSSPAGAQKNGGVRSFRATLLVAMMLVVSAMTALGLFLAERKVSIEAAHDRQQDFTHELATLHGVQEVRRGALTERCRVLVQRARIHAALEDNALDLLYPSANDELRDLLQADAITAPEALHARFYRFLDSSGALISPPDQAAIGELRPEEEAQLAIPSVPRTQQIGYLLRQTPEGANAIDEIIATPIISRETGEVIAALVLGFEPTALGHRPTTGIISGIWLNGRLHLAALPEPAQTEIGDQVGRWVVDGQRSESSFRVNVGGTPYLLFYKQLNAGSLYPPAYEVALYPLAAALARQQQIRSHVLLAGVGLLVVGLLASQFLSKRLSVPVEKLAIKSEQDRVKRRRAEAALETTSEELQRAARFSADASHQLKTPVSVLRAGIDELLARDDLSPKVYDQLSALLHQTYRISGVVDDLLLLSRMDAGRLQIQFKAVDLSQLLEEWIDDLNAVPRDAHINIETDFPSGLHVAGEKRYIMLIVQNLLENAQKYNVPGGRICVHAREEDGFVALSVENTGRPIPPAAQEHIFERFHRGGMGENIPGHGLGLNLARELARLHGGDLRLTKSDAEGTEFEVRFRVAHVAQEAAATAARSAA
jgi:signal transduction histidine kinase